MSCVSFKPKALPLVEESEYFLIYSNFPSQYNKAIRDICDSAIEAYQNEFRMDLRCRNAAKYSVYLDKNVRNRSKLFIENDSGICLRIRNELELIPPSSGGPHHLYGFAHEIGHTAIRFIDREFDEGFAMYLGISCIKDMSARLGSDAWPIPYDYNLYDGMGRLQVLRKSAATHYDVSVAMALFDIERKYGKDPIIRAILCTRQLEKSMTPVSCFIVDLERECNDRNIAEMFSKRSFNWQKLDKKAESVSFEGLVSQDDFRKRTKLMLDRWNGNVYGILDGYFVELYLQSVPGDEKGKRAILPSGITIEKSDDGYLQVFYDDERKIAYIIGNARIVENGFEISDSMIDENGNIL